MEATCGRRRASRCAGTRQPESLTKSLRHSGGVDLISGGFRELGEDAGDEVGGGLNFFRSRSSCGELGLIFQAAGLGGQGDWGRRRIRLSFLGLSWKLGLIFRVVSFGI